jgi:hypothetical protein
MAASASAQNTSEIQPQPDQDGDKHDGSVSHKLQVGGGRCGYRELRSGIECGCQTFWAKGSRESPQCACGHHACFHSPGDGQVGEPGELVGKNAVASSDLSASLMAHLNQLSRLLSTVAPITEAPAQLAAKSANNGALDTLTNSNSRCSHTSAAIVKTAVVSDRQDHTTQSSVSTSYLPRLPSVCLLSEPVGTSNQALQPWRTVTGASSTGLGVWLNDVAAASGPENQDIEQAEYQPGMLPVFDMPSTLSSTEIMPTAPQSVEAQTSANVRGQLLPAIDISSYHNFPGFEDLIQSATEINTPSVGTRTPDLNIPPAVIRFSTENRESLATNNRVSPRNMPPPPNVPRTLVGTPSLTGARRVMTPTSRVISPPLLTTEPQNLREVAGHLQAMRRFMTENVAQLRGLGDRLELVEHTSSFSQVPRDQEIIDKLEMIETRIIDVESKFEDVRVNGVLDSTRSTFVHKRHNQIRESDSAISNQSSQSINSLASLTGDRNGIKIRMDGLDERVTDLEKSMPPSISRPLEIEVVLIPWGRDLRGLWMTPGETFNSRAASRFMTQDTEDWTSLPSSSRVSASLRSGADSGWSNEAIHDWADGAEEWLVPRACSTKSVVYSRLKSRGFVKTLEITKSGAKEVLDSIAKSYGETLVQLNAALQHQETRSAHDCDSPFLGLTAPFIPLRKIHRSSHLRFLTKPEMLTPALWTAEFLSSGVMMHAAGGLKRLFITHTEAYFQRPDSETLPWTWQRIRELPRAGSQMIEEGDARETCWTDHPVLDVPPPSASASFDSHVSSSSLNSRLTHQSASHGAMQGGVLTEVDDEAEVKSESHSGFESEALPTAEKSFAPITPVTEQDISYPTQDAMNHLLNMSGANWYGPHSDDDAEPPSTPHPAHMQTPYNMSANQQRYNLRQHARTLSNPVVVGSASGNPLSRSARQYQQIKPKRITRSFSTPSNPLIATLPSFVPSSPNVPRTRSSRRRGTNDLDSSGNKRRRIDRSVSAEEMASYRAFQRRSRSVSATAMAASKVKRPMTPIGPYMTPYSGNFGDGYLGVGSRGSDARFESDGEVWEGLEGADDDRASQNGRKHVAQDHETVNMDDDDEVGMEEDFFDNDDDDEIDFS